jgi:hypothetical protein
MNPQEIIEQIEKYCKDPLKVLDLTEQLKEELKKNESN